MASIGILLPLTILGLSTLVWRDVLRRESGALERARKERLPEWQLPLLAGWANAENDRDRVVFLLLASMGLGATVGVFSSLMRPLLRGSIHYDAIASMLVILPLWSLTLLAASRRAFTVVAGILVAHVAFVHGWLRGSLLDLDYYRFPPRLSDDLVGITQLFALVSLGAALVILFLLYMRVVMRATDADRRGLSHHEIAHELRPRYLPTGGVIAVWLVSCASMGLALLLLLHLEERHTIPGWTGLALLAVAVGATVLGSAAWRRRRE